MAAEVEIVHISSIINNTTQTLPTNNAVLGTTSTSSKLDNTLAGEMMRKEYRLVAAGSTISLSTAGIIDRVVITPLSTGGGTVVISDGSTAIWSVPAAAHSIDPHPYSVSLGIRSVSTLGFKVVCGASVSCLVVGAWGTPTTA
jgi:hypothetical protein